MQDSDLYLSMSNSLTSEEEEDENVSCKICHDLAHSSKEETIVLHCHHSFHVPCLIKWLERSFTCPHCQITLHGTSHDELFESLPKNHPVRQVFEKATQPCMQNNLEQVENENVVNNQSRLQNNLEQVENENIVNNQLVLEINVNNLTEDEIMKSIGEQYHFQKMITIPTFVIGKILSLCLHGLIIYDQVFNNSQFWIPIMIFTCIGFHFMFILLNLVKLIWVLGYLNHWIQYAILKGTNSTKKNVGQIVIIENSAVAMFHMIGFITVLLLWLFDSRAHSLWWRLSLALLLHLCNDRFLNVRQNLFETRNVDKFRDNPHNHQFLIEKFGE